MEQYVKILSNRQKIQESILRESLLRGRKIGNMVRTHILKSMAGQKSGRVYRVPGTKVFYTASRPGEYPAVRTGRLRSSIQTTMEISNHGVFVAVGTNVLYGAILEGTAQSPGIRPWLSRGFREKLPDIQKVLNAPWPI